MDYVAKSNDIVKADIQTLIDSVQNPEPLQQLPLHNLLSAGFSQQAELIEKLSSLAIDAAEGEDKDNLTALVDSNKKLTTSLQLQSHFRSNKEKGLDTTLS